MAACMVNCGSQSMEVRLLSSSDVMVTAGGVRGEWDRGGADSGWCWCSVADGEPTRCGIINRQEWKGEIEVPQLKTSA